MRCASGDACRAAAVEGSRFCEPHRAQLQRVAADIARAGGPRGRRAKPDDDVVVPDLALTTSELADRISAAVKARPIEGNDLAASFGLDPTSATFRRAVDLAVQRGRVRRRQLRPGHGVVEAAPATRSRPARSAAVA